MDAYQVLRVDARAGDDLIRDAYRSLARRYHPDGSEPDLARMTQVNLAYDKVKTAERRALYDQTRRGLTPVGPGVPNGPVQARPWQGPLTRRVAAHDGGPVVDFGRYAGWTIADIARHDPDYLRWLSRHSTGIRYRVAIERCLPGDVDLGRRSAWVR